MYIKSGPYYTNQGYQDYQGRAAGVTSKEYEEIKKRQANDHRGKNTVHYDDGQRAAGVTSKEYEEIKRRQAMNRPTKINNQYSQQSSNTYGQIKSNNPYSQQDNSNPYSQKGNSNPYTPQNFHQSSQSNQNVQAKNPYLEEDDDINILPDNINQNKNQFTRSKNNQSNTKNPYTQQQNNPYGQSQNLNQFGSGGRVGGGRIIESNESCGVAEAMNINENRYNRNPAQNKNDYSNYRPYGIPTETRPALKTGTESNESYGVSAALNANFVPYDGSVGPREILEFSQYGYGQKPTEYKLGGNMGGFGQ